MALTDSRCANRVVTGAALGASLGGAVGKSRGKRTVEATRSRGETVSSAFPPPLVPAETKVETQADILLLYVGFIASFRRSIRNI